MSCFSRRHLHRLHRLRCFLHRFRYRSWLGFLYFFYMVRLLSQMYLESRDLFFIHSSSGRRIIDANLLQRIHKSFTTKPKLFSELENTNLSQTGTPPRDNPAILASAISPAHGQHLRVLIRHKTKNHLPRYQVSSPVTSSVPSSVTGSPSSSVSNSPSKSSRVPSPPMSISRIILACSAGIELA